MAGQYDPGTFEGLIFHDRPAKFRAGDDDPRAYLERALQVIEAREGEVQAFSSLNVEGARAAADESVQRWRSGRPLSPIDGMPIGIKDLLETRDMPTEMNCVALKGNFPKRDNAAVSALRQAGAVILGKTVTAELGGSHPGPTRNPFDLSRTPGGSSSGSAAAVAANMVPAAIGTQVGGSIVRPAAFCGNVALKPSQGGINRGERQATSMSTHGVHANSFEDMWQVAIEIVARVGGDRGALGLMGPPTPPNSRMPESLIVLETAGWAGLEEATKAAFEELLQRVEAAGVRLRRRQADHAVETLERAISDAGPICADITGWENQWMYRNLLDGHPNGVSHRVQKTLARAEAMTPGDYRTRLAERAQAQAAYAGLMGTDDAVLTLACPGPAPHWDPTAPDADDVSRPTGDAVFNYPSSMLFAPSVSVPMLGVGGLPVGVQIMGRPEADAQAVAYGRWLQEAVAPVSVN